MTRRVKKYERAPIHRRAGLKPGPGPAVAPLSEVPMMQPAEYEQQFYGQQTRAVGA